MIQDETLLPAPGDRPQANIVIFDGNCRFCRGQVERLARCDIGGQLAFISLHDPEVAQRWPDLTHDQLMEEMYVVDRQGRRHAGASAFRYLSRHLVLLWLICPMMHIPFSLPIWQGLYRWVARRRYRIAGENACNDDGTCPVHIESPVSAGKEPR